VPVPDLAAAKITRFCESRTPPQLRDEMRLQVDVRGDSITILDFRPLCHGAPGEWTQMKIAQLRYDPTARSWTIFWADRNGRWHRYDDLEPATDLDDVLSEIAEDPTCIFFG
jgi:hypothetical protein